MGYCYDNRGRLACDSCGACGTTRKRTCPHRVQYAEGGSLPYCQPAALCSTCYAKHKATLHASCAEGAARSNARERERSIKLAGGHFERRTCWGDWHATVPAGYVGVRFVGVTGEAYRLVTAADYEAGAARDWMENYPNAQPWEPHA